MLDILPGANGVHRLMLCKGFKQGGRRVPGDPLQFQEANIKPICEQFLEFFIKRQPCIIIEACA